VGSGDEPPRARATSKNEKNRREKLRKPTKRKARVAAKSRKSLEVEQSTKPSIDGALGFHAEHLDRGGRKSGKGDRRGNHYLLK